FCVDLADSGDLGSQLGWWSRAWRWGGVMSSLGVDPLCLVVQVGQNLLRHNPQGTGVLVSGRQVCSGLGRLTRGSATLALYPVNGVGVLLPSGVVCIPVRSSRLDDRFCNIERSH